MDYMSMDGKSPTRVVQDWRTKRPFALVVPKKGVYHSNLTRRLASTLDGFGYGGMVVRTDQEPAIKDLAEELKSETDTGLQTIAEALKATRNAETLIEHSPAGESQSNGRIERQTQEIQGQFRTIRGFGREHTRRPRHHGMVGATVSRIDCTIQYRRRRADTLSTSAWQAQQRQDSELRRKSHAEEPQHSEEPQRKTSSTMALGHLAGPHCPY